MKPSEIVRSLKVAQPEVLGEVLNTRATAIVRAAFELVAKQIEEQSEGPVVIPGLGRFNVRLVQVTKDGNQQVTKRVMYRAHPVKKAP